MHSRLIGSIVLGVVVLMGAALARSDVRPHAGMLRNPDISATHIVFVYANDLWIAPREGGRAAPLASPPGVEAFPRFSPDGQTIAFMGNYDGNVDLYTVPLTGGVPVRVTHHPASENLCDWTSDNRLLFFCEALAPLERQMQLFTTPATGGLPERLPVPYGANGAISPDGHWLAYTPHDTDNRTWKRYRGGMATDIWLLNLDEHTSLKITDWEGTDSQPMWHGDTVYYMSDAGPDHRLNIWSYEIASEARRQHTHFADYDVKWPAIGPGPNGAGEIVFQNGPDLYALDLATDTVRRLEIIIPGDRADLRPQRVDVSDDVGYSDVSPGGKRAVMEARGDIWTAPARHGSPRNLTRTSGVHDRYPTWSPDGRWLAYFSDATGDYELYLLQSDGQAEPQQRTHHGPGYRYPAHWSPDSKQLAYGDTAGQLWLCSREGEDEPILVDTDPWGRGRGMSWSHDSAWLAYTRTDDAGVSSIWLYDVAAGERHQVTGSMFADGEPTFDREGKYLLYTSHREFDSVAYADLDGTWIYLNTGVLCVVPLRADIDSPWAPKSDEVTWDEDEDDEKEEEKEEEEPEPDEPADEPADEKEGDEVTPPEPPADEQEEAAEPPAEEEADEEKEGEDEDEEEEEEDKPLQIDLSGFEQRAIRLPIDDGYFHNLSVNDKNQLIYARRPGPNAGGSSAIKLFDLEDEDKKEKTVLSDTGSYSMSADGKKLVVRKGRQWGVIDARAGQKLDKPMSLSGMLTEIDPRAEWQEVFVEAWRILRDFFYVENMHGVDWPGVREQYAAMLADCVSRDDVSYVIKEMISELNVGHAYYYGRDVDHGPRMSVGLLGVDFALDGGAYRIERIIAGAPWDLDARGPLSQPNVDVAEGDYLLAVNRVPLDPQHDPWAAFQGLAGRTVTLTVSARPELDDEAREVVVTLLSSEAGLRYRAWVEKNRAYVAEKTGGRVGYIHVPNTSGRGQRELYRQLYGQRGTAALIIDERWNGGGQIPDRFIELLNRPLYNYWARRHGHDSQTPGYGHLGPKCMLINGLAGSGGDAFPAYFRHAGLGKLIGTRTWGGLVGLSGNPGLIDGAHVSVPTFGFYDLDGTWGIEGHGVDPDIEVVDDPALMVDGGDPQLDAAIEHMLAEIERAPYRAPTRPAAPDRSGMGIREEDK